MLPLSFISQNARQGLAALLFIFLCLLTLIGVSQQVVHQLHQPEPVYKNGKFIFSNNTILQYPNLPLQREKGLQDKVSNSVQSFDARPIKKEVVTGVTIILYITTSDASCGYPNGSIIVQATNGIGPYTFSLDGWIQQTGNFPSIYPGTHTLVVTDSSGNIAKASVSINNTVTGPVKVILGTVMPTGCATPDGIVQVFASGGTPPYYYSLDMVNYQLDNTFSNLYPGVYYFQVKDANGCGWHTESLFLFSPCNEGIGSSHSYHECNNNGNIGVYTYDSTDVFSSDGVNYQSTGIFDSLGAGVHTTFVKDTAGLVQAYTLNIIEYCYLALDYIAVDAACSLNDGQLTVNVSNGVPPYAYTIDGINYQPSNVFTGLAPGNYSVTAKDASGTLSSMAAIVYDRCPVVKAVATGESCTKQDGTITAGGFKGTQPYQYSMDGTNFQSGNIFTGLTAGNYTVTIKDALGFTATTDITVDDICLPFTVAATNTTCGNNNGKIEVAITAGTAPYQYSIDSINFQPQSIFSGLAPGFYAVTVKDATGKQTTKTVLLINIPGPLLTTNATAAGCDGTGAAITVSNTGGTAPFQYSLDSLNFQTNNIFNDVNAGNYVMVVKDSNGCIAKDSILVSKYPLPVVFIGNDTGACAGQIILLKAPAGLQYQWQDGNTGNSYAVTNTGLYWVKTTNQYNCFAIDSVNIVFKPLPAFSLGNDTSLCEEQSLNIKISSAPSTASYLWNTGSTASSLIINTLGLYWLKVSDSGCISTDSIIVDYKPLPTVNLGKDTILCEGNILQLNAGNSDTYLWQDGTTTPFYSVSQQGTYYVQVTKNNCVKRDTVTVNYQYKPHFTLGADQFICKGQSLILNPLVTDANFLWQDGSANKTFTVTKPGLYYLSATNECGTLSDSVLVTQGVCNLYMPTAFTPNGDSKNDIFKAGFGEDITNYHLQIYNRFGQLVFETKDKNAGWDGKLKGKELTAGAYVWFVQFSTVGNKIPQQLKGTVLMIR